VQTGGTTGLPMEFSLDNRFSSLKEMLFLRHMWKRVGYRPRSRCVVLREDTISKIVEGETYWKRNLLTNWLIMSSFHLNADTFDIFYRKIVSYKPEFIIAFPSNIYLLAKFMKEKNLNAIPSLKAIICSSENIFDWQRTFMEDIFRTRVFSYYGHSEKCVMASEGTNTNEYEFFPQYGYAEIVNDEGDHCTKNNERGEIIATGFDNFASPFIRYKTEDIAVLSTDGNTDHKHWLSIKNIEGRKQDFLIDNDEVPKSYIYIDRPFWEMKDQIYAYQYIQDKPGEIQLNVQAKEKLTRQQIENIKSTFYRTYFKMALTVHQVDHIPRTNRGKFKYLIQNIKQTQ
jgi:phenylacetate-CoA ligase